jgi:hypothetical protein
MAIILQGNSGTAAEVEANSRAIRVVGRGIDPGSLGCYRLSVRTGLMAAGLAANAEVFQFRWTDATRLAIVERISFDGLGSVTAFAAGVASLYATAARAWTVDGSGGTAVTMSTNNQKQRTSMGTSLVGAIRIASTAALTAGTKTLDAQDFGQAVGGLTATAGAGLSPQSMQDVLGLGFPLVLASNEGFVIRATVPATGTWTAGFTIHWTEVTSY